MESSAGVYSGKSGGESMKRPQKLAVMLVPTPPYEICGLWGELERFFMAQSICMRESAVNLSAEGQATN
jgi:hypothetical protein